MHSNTTMDTLPTLPHMTERELEDFLRDNARDLKFTPQSADTLRIRRRRQSLHNKEDQKQWEIMQDKLPLVHSSFSHVDQLVRNDNAIPMLKVVVLGDDILPKLELVSAFLSTSANGKEKQRGQDNSGGQGAALHDMDLHMKMIHLSTNNTTHNGQQQDTNYAVQPSALLQVWAPQSGSMYRNLRQEIYDGVDVFVVTYSVKDRASFDNVSSLWMKEIESHLSKEEAAQRLPCDVPIILVGMEADIRNAKVGLHAIAVSSTEAVQFAQDMGASKYVETYAHNIFHAHEVFQQAANVTLTNRLHSAIPLSISQSRFLLANCEFIDHLRVPQPRGTFDLINRTFCLTTEPDVNYFITVDGSDPITSTTAFKNLGPLEFDKPFPKVVKVVGRGRCRFPSVVTSFTVPMETPAPQGYFDVGNKTFHLDTRHSYLNSSVQDDEALDGIQYRYTTDGSNPTARSAVYSEPIHFDQNPPMAAWSQGQRPPPSVIRVIAVGDGMFGSKVASFEAPPILEAPRVQYNNHDGTFVVETSAMFEYRYTLDGSVPTYFSTPYVRPVMIPRDHPNLKQIRVAVFPKLFFPSKEAIIEVPHQLHRDPGLRTIGTTKTAMARIHNAQTRRQSTSSVDSSKVMLMAPGSRNASAVVNTNRTNSPMGGSRTNSPMRTSPTVNRISNSPSVNYQHMTSGVTSVVHQQFETPAPNTGVLSPQRRQAHQMMPPPPQTRPSPGDATTPVAISRPPPGAPPPPPVPINQSLTYNTASSGVDTRSSSAATIVQNNVACNALDNQISFDFETPISVSHISVATPGQGKGPTSYEVRVAQLQDPAIPGVAPHVEWVSAGRGELEDFDGIQTLHVMPSARLLPVVKVQCVFSTEHGGQFQINDMKIHGKPFKPQ